MASPLICDAVTGRCLSVSCPAISTNYRVVYSSPVHFFQSTATVSCDPSKNMGDDFNRQVHMVCQVDGRWSELPPVCFPCCSTWHTDSRCGCECRFCRSSCGASCSSGCCDAGSYCTQSYWEHNLPRWLADTSYGGSVIGCFTVECHQHLVPSIAGTQRRHVPRLARTTF
jgi:hypothetical protein